MTDPVIVALIPALASIVVILITTLWQNSKLNTIHVLVNSQLQTALSKIEALEAKIMGLTGMRSVNVLQKDISDNHL